MKETHCSVSQVQFSAFILFKVRFILSPHTLKKKKFLSKRSKIQNMQRKIVIKILSFDCSFSHLYRVFSFNDLRLQKIYIDKCYFIFITLYSPLILPHVIQADNKELS